MINGFVIEIKNTSTQNQCIQLFSEEELSEGIIITTRNQNFDYNALRYFAMNEGFIGSGVSSDEVLEFTIHNGDKSESFTTKFLPEKEIEIDGGSKFIEVNIPSDTIVLFQLLPSFK